MLEPETVIALIVHLRDGAVQTSVNRRIVTEEDLIRWLSTVFTRADWQPEALVMVGSGGDDELMPILEDALSVPVFAPAEAQLALARGAALASAQNVEGRVHRRRPSLRGTTGTIGSRSTGPSRAAVGSSARPARLPCWSRAC